VKISLATEGGSFVYVTAVLFAVGVYKLQALASLYEPVFHKGLADTLLAVTAQEVSDTTLVSLFQVALHKVPPTTSASEVALHRVPTAALVFAVIAKTYHLLL
jgi:hypothetical protein